MRKSPNDNKEYQALTLANGLRVVAISNYESKKAAAALTVNVGHFNDPADRQGMAHFLEHMLFLGTEKYPDGSEYQKFISKNGGSNNAWTATEHTSFFFDIQHSAFEAALDRFSQFFTAPMLSQEFVSKERKNIDSEFKLKLKDDIRRLYDVHKETINQAHPFSQFSVGNIDTLADRENSSIRDEVANFFEHYYCAEYMTLALEAPMPLDQICELATAHFSGIKQAKAPLQKITEPLYLPEHQKIKLLVKPVKNERQLIVSFALPSIDSLYRHKPESLLAYLIGHEGPGSLLSLLKQHQWALRLTAGSGINGSNFKDFNINISLTELGEDHIDDIVALLFSYLALLKSKPIPEYFYQEKQAIAKLSFDFLEKQRPLDTVNQMSLNMQHYPECDYIYGDYVLDSMSQEKVDYLLSYFNSDNMRIVHISKNNEFDRISHWYQVPYRVSVIASDLIAHWALTKPDNRLFLPPPNPYISTAPVILDCQQISALPRQLSNNANTSCWFKQDHTFKVPKGHIYLGIDTPVAIESTNNIVMTRLFIELFNDKVVEQNYAAELAGIHYHLYSHQGGMTLQLSGLSEKQPQLLQHLLNSLRCSEFQESRFNLFKKQLITQWQNTDKSKSIAQLFAKLSSAMQPKNPSSDDMAHALAQVNFEQFTAFYHNLFNATFVEMLIHGNWQEQHALAILEQVEASFAKTSNAQNRVKIPVTDMSQQGDIVLPLTLPEHDHASVLYYPQGDKALTTTAKTMVTSHLLSPLFFQEMRTEKQYGYLVGVGYIPINRYPGIAFYIQSPHTEAENLTLAIEQFIERSSENIAAMPEGEWQQLKQGLAGQLLEKDTSLRIKSQRFWAAICHRDFSFDHKKKLIEALLAIELSDIQQFIKESLIKQTQPDRLTLLSLQQNTTKLSPERKVITESKKLIEITAQKY